MHKFSGESILLIDDERALCDVTVSRLCLIGLKAEACYSVEQALQMMKENTYQLIISDYRLKDGTAEDIIMSLNEKGVSTPIIITTGIPELKLEKSSDEIMILEKPVNFENLTNIIRKLV